MNIKAHLLASGLVAAGEAVQRGRMSATIVLASVLGGVAIDLIDHSLYSVLTVRPFKLTRAIAEHRELYKKMEPRFYVFHTFEIYVLSSFLALNFWWGKYFVISYGLHLLMDIYKYTMKKKSWDFVKWWCASYYLANKISESK